jgi:hypothetical protein
MNFITSPVRYFATIVGDVGEVDVEIERLCFEYLAKGKHAVHYNRHTMHENGANQICLTLSGVYDVNDLDIL